MVRTERGRVVYDRKEHAFTCKDLVRIGKSIADVSTLSEQAHGFNDILSNYFSEEAVSFSEWLEWLDIAIDFFGAVLLGPKFSIKAVPVHLKGFLVPGTSQEELVHRYAVRKLRDEADTIEGI
ncbi:hypothetical protein ES705_42934 [subsurface metagenome]